MVYENREIAVIGAGAWGTALAQRLCSPLNPLMLLAREKVLADDILKTGENKKYLPGVKLALGPITVTSDPAAALAGKGIILLATPAQHIRETLKRILPHLKPGAVLVNCAKGIEIKTGKLLSEVVAEVAPGHPYAVLSGPTFANEVAAGLPTAVTVASSMDPDDLKRVAFYLEAKNFRVYIGHDPIGSDIAGALKNVIAIACGIVEGKKLGQNAKAAVMTRGMAEIRRYGVAKGAKVETFLGLSGIGDLMLTCHSMTSRNFSLGYELGQDKKIEDILKSRISVAEGVPTAKAVAEASEKTGIDMPISKGVYRILHEGAEASGVITGLLGRVQSLKEETV